MRVLCAALLATLLVLGATTPTRAQAPDGTSPESAIQLTSAEPQSGHLVGDVVGEFAYYWIDYPGDGRDAVIAMGFAPADDPMSRSIGLHVWQGNVRLTNMTGVSGTRGANRVTFFSNRRGPLLVQVFNYLPGREVFFQLTLTGLPVPSGVTPSVAPAPAPTPEAAPAEEPGDRLTDMAMTSITGDSGGAYAYYWIENQPWKTGTLRLEFSPSDATTTRSVGISVWRGAILVGKITGGESPDKGATMLSFSTGQSGPLLVQIANHRSGAVANFKVILTWR